MDLQPYYVEDIGEPESELDPLVEIPLLSIEEYKEMRLKPSPGETVGLTSPGVWSIGSLMICEVLQDGAEIPPDVVCTWSDDGAQYYLRKRSVPKADKNPEGDYLVGRFGNYHGLCRGIWNLSPNVFCKVKAWAEGLTTEATTIRWVNKNVPSVPTEEIIYDWVDTEWERTIMISKRVPGKTCREVWPSLTMQQRLQVADQVAGHQKALSEMTSDYVETVQGTGIAGKYSLRVRESAPAWKPIVEPRVFRDDYEAYIKRCDELKGIKTPHPCLGEPFVLQHTDCNPTNFFITTPSSPDQIPKVTAIIDWERIGYLPRWRAATYPRVLYSFIIGTHPFPPGAFDWQWMLSNACVRAGFPLALEYMKDNMRRNLKHYPEIPVRAAMNLSNLPPA